MEPNKQKIRSSLIFSYQPCFIINIIRDCKYIVSDHMKLNLSYQD